MILMTRADRSMTIARDWMETYFRTRNTRHLRTARACLAIARADLAAERADRGLQHIAWRHRTRSHAHV